MLEEDTNMENILEELNEYKKLTQKLENELIYKANEISSMIKACNNYESKIEQLNEEIINLKKENSSLIQKNNELLDNNDLLTKEIIDINNRPQEEIKYVKNINELSDKINLINKDELNKKILELEKMKNEEISLLREQIINLTREKGDIELKLNNQIRKNFDSNKKDLIYQNMNMNINNNNNYNDNDNIFLNETKNERNEMFQKIIKELKKQNVNNDKNNIIAMLTERLRKEKEKNLKEMEKIEQNHLDEIKDLKSKNMMLINKLNGLNDKLSYKDIQILDIQKKIDQMNITYQNLENNNTLLMNENNFLKKEKNDLKNSIDYLKNEIEIRKEDFLIEKKKYEKNIKTLNSEINNYQDMLNKKEKENNELHNNYNNIIEEKKLLSEKIDKFIQEENELNLNIYDKDNKKIIKKYIKENYIIEKDEEIKSLNKYIDKIKKEYFEAIDKKKYYKTQCKNINDKLDIIKNILTQQQIEKIQNEIKSKGLN